jgi:hypothetical protein
VSPYGTQHPNARPDARERAYLLATQARAANPLDWARRYMAADAVTRRGMVLELDAVRP